MWIQDKYKFVVTIFLLNLETSANWHLNKNNNHTFQALLFGTLNQVNHTTRGEISELCENSAARNDYQRFENRVVFLWYLQFTCTVNMQVWLINAIQEIWVINFYQISVGKFLAIPIWWTTKNLQHHHHIEVKKYIAIPSFCSWYLGAGLVDVQRTMLLI